MYFSTKIKNHVINLRDFIFDILFPIKCVNCRKEGSWLCKNCFSKIKFQEKQNCPICRIKNDFGNYCDRCKTKKHLNGIWIANDYHNIIIKKLIKLYKYRFVNKIAGIFGKHLYYFINHLETQNSIDRYLCKTLLNIENTILIPVPLHKKRLKWRGFNQSYQLLREINKYTKISENNVDLVRIKYKKPQTKLKAKYRKENIKNCFAWHGTNLKKRNIILVDDITTTGATLEECARILKKNGAGEIWGLVIARN